MNENGMDAFGMMSGRYDSGDLPWDQENPPPEVLEFVPNLEPGVALDLGCGYGRASIYLARQGWKVDGVDFVPQAIRVARLRAQEAGVKVDYHLSEITDLDFLTGPYDFSLDVGCCHNLDSQKLAIFKDHLHRLLRVGGYFLLYVRLREPGSTTSVDGPKGLVQKELLNLFREGFDLDWMEIGETAIPSQEIWKSGWFRWRRAG